MSESETPPSSATPEANPLLQPNLGAAVPQSSLGEQVLAAEAPPEQLDLALGQVVELRTDTETGKALNNTRGLVYYYDPGSLLKIQVDGLPSKLVDVPIVKIDEDEEGPIYDFDPELINKPIKILEPTSFQAFVEIIGFQPGQVLDSFKNGVAGPILLVKEPVNPKLDTMDIVDLDGDLNELANTRRTLTFGFIGIERDQPFDVLRPRGTLEDLKKKADELDEPVGAPAEEAPSSEIVFEEIVIPKLQGLQLIAGKDIAATDDEQRGDMITDLRRNPLPEWRGKTLTKDEYLRYVDTLMRLRNDIVQYNSAGTPTGDVKPTSIDMLLELVESGLPLARPVLDAKLNLYIDARGLRASKGDKLSTADQNIYKEIEFNMLKDVVENSIQSLNPIDITTKRKAVTEPGPHDIAQEVAVINVNEDPGFIREWKQYLRNYFQVWKAGIARPTKEIQEDIDFFRMVVPAVTKEDSGVVKFGQKLNGLPRLGAMMDGTKILTDDYIGKVKLSVRRALRKREGRPAENLELVNGRRIDTRGMITVSPADAAAIYNYIIFPYATTRSMGPTRSGKVLFDSYRSSNCITLIEDIFTVLDGISPFPAADSIFLLKKDKETALENIQISEWIKNIPIPARGFEDYEDLFISIGLQKFELNRDQFDAISQAIKREYARRVATIRKLRERSNEIAKQTPEFEPRPFIESSPVETLEEGAVIGADDKSLLQLLQSHDKLREAMQRLRRMTPAYKNIDLAILAYLQVLYPDYVSAVISQNQALIAKERQAVAKDIYLDAVRVVAQEEQKKRSAGQQPIENPCSHAKDLIKMRGEKDITRRMMLLRMLYETYHKGEKGNWYTCVNCEYPLMCKHEYLQIQQFLHPNESKVLYKTMLLNYSGGQFMGNYICKGCGQPISEIEYDDNVEFDDNGIPKFGSAPLELDEDGKEKAIQDFNGPAVDEDANLALGFKLPEKEKRVSLFKGSSYCGFEEPTNYKVLNCIRTVAAYLYHSVGVSPSDATFQKIVDRAYTMLFLYASAKDLSEDKNFKSLLKRDKEQVGKKITVQNFLNQRLVGFTACLILLDIQCRAPPYEVKFSMPGCQASFKGFPLSGDPRELEAISYMSCILRLTRKDEAPWTYTGWYGINQEKLGIYLNEIMVECMSLLLKESDVQERLLKKRKWIEDTYGESAMREKLPSSFLPVPFNPAKPGPEYVEAAADPASKMQIILQKAHAFAKESKDANVVETTDSTVSCCFDSIQEPGKFWLDKGITWPGTTKPAGSKGSRLVVHFKARPLSKIRLEVPENLFSRVFLKVCFRGPRKGLPHEPGYTNICPHCEFDFGMDPAIMDNVDKEGGAALDNANVDRDEESFQDLLDEVHNRQKVVLEAKAKKLTRTDILTQLARMNPSPYSEKKLTVTDKDGIEKTTIIKGWKLHIKPLRDLPDDATDEEKIEALKDMETRMVQNEGELRKRLGRINVKRCLVEETCSGTDGDLEAVDVLKQLAELPPEELKNFLQTYLITPMNRGLQNQSQDILKVVLSDHDLGPAHKEEVIAKVLTPQSGPKAAFKDFFHDERAYSEEVLEERRAKAEKFVARLHQITTVLSNLRKRAIYVKNDLIIKTLTKSMIYGALVEYDEPQVLGYIRCFLGKYQMQGKRFTAEEIRRVIAEIAEMEKQRFIAKTKDKSIEEKRLDRLMRHLGIGDYAIGGTKAIWAYDPERWEKEREDRIKNGQIDWFEDPNELGMPQGRKLGKDGMPITGPEEAEFTGRVGVAEGED